MFKWISYNKLNLGQKALASLDEGISSNYFHNREFKRKLKKRGKDNKRCREAKTFRLLSKYRLT